MKKMLWIGSYATEAVDKELQKLGYVNAAAHISQKNLLEGIEKNTGEYFDSIGAVVLPENKKKRLPRVDEITFKHSEQSEDILVGYLNIKYLNKWFTQQSMLKAAKKWVKKNKGAEETDIYIYEMRSTCLKSAVYIKKHLKNVKIHLIVPDLPLFMDLNMNAVKRVLKGIDWKNMVSAMEYVDDYILYSAPMAKYLKLDDKKWMVMEGSINVNDVKENDAPAAEESEVCSVIYSGFLDNRYGLSSLMDAFEHLDDKYELWITGGGPYKAEIEERAKKDKRIKFYGFLPTRQDLLELQKKATVMLNIRNPEEEASKYCFPSKIFEYMLSGKPVLSTKIEGIPAEYFDYLVEIENMEPVSIANAIKRVGAMTADERNALGKKGREFVLSEKNNLKQTERILEFI